MQEAIMNAVQPLLDTIQEKVIDTVSEALKQAWEKFASGFKNTDANIININVETLDQKKLVEIAAENKVEGGTEVAAYKVATDDDYIIYLAYTKDRELLDSKINNYVIIRCQYLARDVEKLFNNDKLILLR